MPDAVAATATGGSKRYVPAAGRAWLTGSYDHAVALTMRERAWRPALVDAVSRDLPAGGTVIGFAELAQRIEASNGA